MKVALYQDHHELPFGRVTTKNPTLVYTPGLFNDWTYKKSFPAVIEGIDCLQGKIISAIDYWAVPFLDGLCLIDIPGIMAHVSLGVSPEENRIIGSKRNWIQITTATKRNNADGLPIVVSGTKVKVKLIWASGMDDSYSPYSLLEKNSPKEKDTPKFWKLFFFNELLAAKKNLFNEGIKAIEKAREAMFFCSLIPENI